MSRDRLWVLVLLGVLAGWDGLRAEDWPQFRGPGGVGVSAEKGLPTQWSKSKGEGIRWKAELPGRGLSSPVVVRGRVFVTCSSGYRDGRLHVLCFDARTGEKVWERQFVATGNTNAHPRTCMAAPTPVSDGDNVYALFATGDLTALDRDGNLVWYRSLVSDYPNVTNQVGMASSPTLSGSTLLLPLENAGDSFVAGLDVKTGRNRWKVKRARDVNWVSPLVVRTGSGAVAIFQTAKEATAFDPETGKVRWQIEGEDLTSIPSPAFGDGVVLLPGKQNVALKLRKDGSTPETSWTVPKLTAGYPSPLIHDGKVYGLNAVGLNCLSLADGKQLWQQRITGPFWASPLLADGKVYVVNEKGLTTVVGLGDKPAVLARNDLDDEILATPAIADGALFVRSDRWLYCVGEKK